VRCPSLADLPAPPPDKSGWPWTEESLRLPDKLPDGRPWPRVSIVTPSYNQGDFIEETIRSVLLQGYPDLEYIILDGGSTDGSVDIIRKYEPWLAHWVSKRDGGQTEAINNGWRKATGEILAYINSDDCYLAGAIAAAVEGFQSDSQTGMVYGTAIIVDETGKELRVWKGQPFDLKTTLTVGSIVPQPTAFFSGKALKRIGYLDEKWHMIMDYDLCIRISVQWPTVCLPGTLARFRDHRQSKTNTRFEATATELIYWLATFSPEHISPEEWRAIKWETLSRVHYEWAMAYLANGRQYAPKALKQLVKSLLQYPLFVLKRPMGTSYLLKEVLLSYFTAIGV